MKQSLQSMRAFMVSAMLVVAGAVQANSISVTNTVLGQFGTFGSTYVECDVTWDNSWRASWLEGSSTVTNWDAAWIFVKYRVVGGDGSWQHATLSTNNSDHIVPSQALFNVGTSSNAVNANFGVGGFLYRKNEASGNWTNHIKLCWNFAQDGVSSKAQVVVSVQAIEMVYVPQGSFYAGDGAALGAYNRFCSNNAHTTPFPITGEGALNLGGGAGGGLNSWGVWQENGADEFNDNVNKTLSADFPKGYNAFYCMKYELSEGQWVSFFNMLTTSQKTTRDITSSLDGGKNSDAVVMRNTVAWTTGDATTMAPDRACNYLKWPDVTAYADWAGLRPMTELEFEKACRGPVTPVAHEYPWGTTSFTFVTNFFGADGSGIETADNPSANCVVYYSWYHGNGYPTVPQGPVRCGMFATSTSGRVASGATYWGIMNMGDNLSERIVSVSYASGRAFTRVLGNGRLNATGNADEANSLGLWGEGAAIRGANWNDPNVFMETSDRVRTAEPMWGRNSVIGFRAVRQMP